MKEKVFDLIGKIKVCYGNAGTYISMVNFALLLSSFKILYNIEISAYILIPMGISFLLLLGYFDYRFVLQQQTKYVNEKNSIKHQLDRIEKQLNEEFN